MTLHGVVSPDRLLEGVTRFEIVPWTGLTFGIPETLREVDFWWEVDFQGSGVARSASIGLPNFSHVVSAGVPRS